MFKLIPMVRFSVYFADATMMVSPKRQRDGMSEVLHAVVGDKQLLLSFPLTPSTNHVVLTTRAGTEVKSRITSGKLKNFGYS